MTRTTVNPFTGKEMTITTRAPEWDDFDPENVKFPAPQVVAFTGDYRKYLERRIPPLVQSQPHWCAKGLTSVELEPLVTVVTGVADPRLESPLYDHPTLGRAIVEFPDDFLARLKCANEDDLLTMARQWAAEMSTPEHTHSVAGDRLSDGWSTEDALSLLKPIAELARQQSVAQVLYLLLES